MANAADLRSTFSEPSPLSNRGSVAWLASPAVSNALERGGGAVLRYGLVAILFFLGAFKFTAVEAQGIQPLVAHSPLTAWLYHVFSVQGASNLIGAAEIVIGALIVARRWSPRLAAAGGLGAVGMFATTLSFLATTPGVWSSVPGFPLPVPNETGFFLLKDVFLLGAALWSTGEAARAWRAESAGGLDREAYVK